MFEKPTYVLNSNSFGIDSKYIVRGKTKYFFLDYKKNPFKLELSCKDNRFYPISQLFKSKRRGLKIDGFMATDTSKLKCVWQA